MLKLVKQGLHHLGLDVRRYPPALAPDFSAETREIIQRVRPFTMTSPERVAALCDGVRYLCRHHIPGAIVECGVWKGGSMMAVALSLNQLQRQDRELYLFDTFSGMSEPSALDVDLTGKSAIQLLREEDKAVSDSVWCYAGLEEVKEAVYSTHYPPEKIHFIPGKVEDTLPEAAPPQIALLRLDTDWYESTYHELTHLFPRLAAGAVIIIDDYGHWQGARQAVDQYLQENNIPLLLNRVDATGRIGVVYPGGY